MVAGDEVEIEGEDGVSCREEEAGAVAAEEVLASDGTSGLLPKRIIVSTGLVRAIHIPQHIGMSAGASSVRWWCGSSYGVVGRGIPAQGSQRRAPQEQGPSAAGRLLTAEHSLLQNHEVSYYCLPQFSVCLEIGQYR
jgi:hypothetical protein